MTIEWFAQRPHPIAPGLVEVERFLGEQAETSARAQVAAWGGRSAYAWRWPPAKEPMIGDVPRRCRIDLVTPAERAIYEAAGLVEELGASPLLTDAVEFLAKARASVADWIDNDHTAGAAALSDAACVERPA